MRTLLIGLGLLGLAVAVAASASASKPHPKPTLHAAPAAMLIVAKYPTHPYKEAIL